MTARHPETHPLSRALVDAAFVCDFVRVRELLGQGAHPDARDGDGRTPIFSAVLGGSVGVLGLLLEAGADVNAQDQDGWTALHFSAQENLPQMAQVLIGRGADVNRRDNDGATPLWRAVQSSAGHPDVTSILVQAGAKDDIANAAGETPRQLADRLGFSLFDLN
jgi:ankyrin repeat protein